MLISYVYLFRRAVKTRQPPGRVWKGSENQEASEIVWRATILQLLDNPSWANFYDCCGPSA
jgi:hypothetical protein